MRVLYVINGLGTGGTERSLAEMLPGLVARGADPVVAALYHRSAGVEHERLAGERPPHFLSATSHLGRARELRSLIRQIRPDLIHTMLFEASVAARIGAAGTGVPVLSSLVNTPYDRRRFADPRIKPRKLRAVRLVDGWTARNLTTHFHAVSMAVLRHAVRQLRVRPDRVSVIRRGRDPQRLGRPSAERRRAARRELGLHGDSPVLVNMGRHEYQKGQRYLLEAVTELLPKYPGITALIAGREGSATAELRTLAGQLCVEENVRFLGHRQDVPEILAAGDVFVFPSLFEGLPGAVLEAMALGLPIVASRIEPLLEVVEEGSNALLFTPRRSSELARCVDRLLSAQDVAGRFGRRSREIFDSGFTIEQSTDQMADLYAELVRGWSVPN